MPNFVFAYHGGEKPESPEEGAKFMERWRAWSDGLGDVWTNRGSPLGQSRTVSSGGVSDDGGSNPLSGYSVVQADSMDDAVKIAQSCPHVESGTIEVAEVLDMEM